MSDLRSGYQRRHHLADPRRWLLFACLQMNSLSRRANQESSIPSALAQAGVLEQLCVFGFCGLKCRNAGVSIFPESEELFVLSQSAYTGGVRDCPLRLLRFQRICASHTKMS